MIEKNVVMLYNVYIACNYQDDFKNSIQNGAFYLRKRYLGVYSHGKFNFMDEKEALCAEHRAYCDVCVKNNVLMVDMTVWESPFCHPEFISGSIQGGSLQFNAYKMLLEFLPRSQSFGKGTLFQ